MSRIRSIENTCWRASTGRCSDFGLEYVDLLYCHRADPTTPIEETVWAMHNIIERGKALYWGTSEWEADDILSAIAIAERHHLHKPVVEQPVYNLFSDIAFAAGVRSRSTRNTATARRPGARWPPAC